jgi:N-acetylneuraminic acid mutarotase
VQWNDLWKYNISTRQWTWVKGDNTTGSAGVYGTLGTASPSNLPGARRGSMSWRDNAGNLWLMGGSGFAASGSGYLNDLWKYNTSTNEWTWMGGTNAVEGTGVYGTRGVASPANAPGARGYAARWSDSAGNLWLMGGEGYGESGSSGNLNDLWKYSTATNQWTWIGGAKTTGTSGVYGSKGVTSSTNVPGARSALASWSDSAGNLWLMGGEGNAASGSGLLNDLWKYNIANNQWTWMSGANTADGAATFGTQGTTGVANVPGARSFFNSWSDTFGNLWLFGGTGHAGSAAIGMLSDLWKYNISTNQWTWVSGTTAFDSAGIYGTLGTTNSANAPGAREGAAAWTDSAGDFWLFGGDSTDVNSTREGMNDLWRYLP